MSASLHAMQARLDALTRSAEAHLSDLRALQAELVALGAPYQQPQVAYRVDASARHSAPLGPEVPAWVHAECSGFDGARQKVWKEDLLPMRAALERR